MNHELIYWSAFFVALGGSCLSIHWLVKPSIFVYKDFSEKIARIAMTVTCIFSLILCAFVLFLGVYQLIEWGSCL